MGARLENSLAAAAAPARPQTVTTPTTTITTTTNTSQELYGITLTIRQSSRYVVGTNYTQGYNCSGYTWTVPNNGTSTNLLWTKHSESFAQESRVFPT
jgi:transposase InsO family protein